MKISILQSPQDFTVNFGQMPGPLCPLEQGYTPIGQLDFADGIVRLFMLEKMQIIHYDSIHKSHLELCNDADHEMSQTGVRSHLLVELIVKPS